ncbi:MAG: HGGxSTG domain-containing protein [Rhodospirillales bacterium]
MKAGKPSSAMSTQGGQGMHKKARFKPMLLDMQQAPRCGAKTRKGSPCQSPAMKNGRCRMHGGLSTGAPKGNKNAFKHGYYTAESIAQRRMIRALLKESRELVASI